jgi:hypothetical protein
MDFLPSETNLPSYLYKRVDMPVIEDQSWRQREVDGRYNSVTGKSIARQRIVKTCFAPTNTLGGIKALPRNWDTFRGNGWNREEQTNCKTRWLLWGPRDSYRRQWIREFVRMRQTSFKAVRKSFVRQFSSWSVNQIRFVTKQRLVSRRGRFYFMCYSYINVIVL